METKLCNPDYLEKAQLLTEEEAERLLSRMAGKLPRRLEKDKLSREEALAIQLEIEDDQLQEWRNKMHFLKEKENSEKKVNAEGKTHTKKKSKPNKEPKQS